MDGGDLGTLMAQFVADGLVGDDPPDEFEDLNYPLRQGQDLPVAA